MEKDNSFRIHVQISGFRIPLNINREDEEMYRKAEKLVAQLMDKYTLDYHQRSTQEILSIVVYQLAVIATKQEYLRDSTKLLERLKILDNELAQLLDKE